MLSNGSARIACLDQAATAWAMAALKAADAGRELRRAGAGPCCFHFLQNFLAVELFTFMEARRDISCS
ncbi:MAG: hypothetical protein QM636_10955 [Rhizobium sp.]